jgi:SnoaL-like polyketide cyclase
LAAKGTPDEDKLVEFAKTISGAFEKDARFSSDGLLGVDDVVVSKLSMTGTYAGALGPLKPTKKRVTIHGRDIMVVKDGRLVSGSSYSNSLELLGQEGPLEGR